MLLETREFLTNSLHFITIVATPLHVFGIYCILFETPKNMQSVKLSLLNLHASCMLMDWGLTVLSVPFLIFPAMGGFPLGILTKWFGVSTLVQIYSIISSIFVAATSVVLIFENRYYQLYARETSWRYFRIPFMLLNYLLTFTHLIPACILVPDQKLALEHVYKVTVIILNMLVPAIYVVFSITSDFYSQAANNAVFICLALHGISSTSIMLWAHRPYREACWRIINKANNISNVPNRVPKVASIVVTCN